MVVERNQQKGTNLLASWQSSPDFIPVSLEQVVEITSNTCGGSVKSGRATGNVKGWFVSKIAADLLICMNLGNAPFAIMPTFSYDPGVLPPKRVFRFVLAPRKLAHLKKGLPFFYPGSGELNRCDSGHL